MRIPGALAAAAVLGSSWTVVYATSSGSTSSASPSPPVHIKLRGPWPVQPPLLLEALEATASEDANAFFPLLNDITGPKALTEGSESTGTDPGLALAQASSQQVYRAVHKHLAKLNYLADHAARQNFNLSLALHAEAAKVEAFWQVYATNGLEERWTKQTQGLIKDNSQTEARESCGSWVDLQGQVICNSEELQEVLSKISEKKPQAPSPALLPFDHVLPAPLPNSGSNAGLDGESDSYTAVLYADPYSANFFKLHTLLFQAAVGPKSKDHTAPASRLQYILRWRPPPQRLTSISDTDASAGVSPAVSPRLAPYNRQKSYLPSYGGTLDLKKVDYLVIDDRKLKHSSDGKDAGGADGHKDTPALLELEDRQKEREEKSFMKDLLAGGKAAADQESTVEGSMGDLNAEEIESLGMRATTLILQSPDPLLTLRQLSHNFPTYAVALARSYEDRLAPGGTEVEMKGFDAAQEIYQRQGYAVQAGSSDMWLNGRGLAESELWPLSMVEVLRKERRIIRALENIHPSVNRTQAVDLLQFPAISRAATGGGQNSGPPGGPPGEEVETIFFDASDRIERRRLTGGEGDVADVQGPITYWNNVEKDDFYKRYPSALRTLLRPAWPGSLPTIRRNLFNVVLVMDLRRHETIRMLTEQVAMTIPRVGIRWGFVPGGLDVQGTSGEATESATLARLYYFAFLNLEINQVTTFLLRVASKTDNTGPISVDLVRTELVAALKHAGKKVTSGDSKVWPQYVDNELLQGKVDEVEKLLKAAIDYTVRLRATAQDHERGHMFVNGQHLPFSGTALHALNSLISEQLQRFSRELYRGNVNEDADVEHHFYDLAEAFSSRPSLVFPRPDMETGAAPVTRIVDLLEATSGFPSSGQVVNSFIYPSAEQDGAAAPTPNATAWVVGDLDTVEGVTLVQHALELVLESSVRLGFVHRPSRHSAATQTEIAAPRLSIFLYQLISKGALKHVAAEEMKTVLADFANAIPPSNVVPVGKIHDNVAESSEHQHQMKSSPDAATSELFANFVKEAGWHLADAVESTSFWQQADLFAQRLGVQADTSAVVVGGRVLTVPKDGATADDLRTLLKYETIRRIQPVVDGLAHVGVALEDLGRESYTDTVTLASSILAKAFTQDPADGIGRDGLQRRSHALERLPTPDSSFEIGTHDSASFRLVAMINPLSERAQRMIAIIELLSKFEDVWIKVIFNPNPLLTELPLKRFYRFSAPHELAFVANEEVVSPSLTFFDMPQQAVLTMGLEAPSAWLTMPEEAIYDLDNIRLKDVPPQERQGGVSATYEIKHVLIEGHAQSDGRTPPRGLQLVLESPDGSQQLDTIVMANLAYFQFKARPGMFHLTIREGRSRDIYELESVGTHGISSPNVSVTGNIVILNSLNGLTILPKFVKRPGMEDEEVLEEDIDKTLAEGMDSKKTSFFGQARSAVSSLAKQATNLIGTTGSGRTNAAINIFTVASGHLYERMTYIMILSVLKHTKSTVKFWFIENFLSPSFKEFIPHLAAEYGFQYELITYAWPHWLRAQREKQRVIWGYKILFLDVLFPLDLDKVIFVDADQIVRTDMKELVDVDLHGAPYGYPPMGNDSYDMDNFRFWEQGYWKDFLRGKPYHISALYVVDLNRFREVAAGDILRGQYQGLSSDPASLANLDQDLPNHQWLPQAKTIDLCSNPKTKEPKLDRARRQIPEWTKYDDEVAAFAQRLAEANRLGKNVVAPAEVERIAVKERMEEVKEDVERPQQDASDTQPPAGRLHDEL
ncbi:killer toxin resistant protein [Tilletia horrida]|nr:killer toxin resistant protein [Tilletia horrida]